MDGARETEKWRVLKDAIAIVKIDAYQLTVNSFATRVRGTAHAQDIVSLSSNKNASPDRTFHNFRASLAGDRSSELLKIVDCRILKL